MFYSLIFRNVFFQFLSRGTTTFVGFITALLIARHFGASGFGDFTKVSAFVGLFYLFVDFGLNAIFLQRSKIKNSFAELFYTRFLFSLAGFILIVLISFFLPYSKETGVGFPTYIKIGIVLFAFTIFNQGFLITSSAVFQRKLKYEFLFISQIIGSLINLALIVFFVLKNFSLLFIFGSFSLSGIIASLISLFLTKEKITPISFKIPKKLISQSLPIGLMLVFNLIYFRADMIILSYFKTSTDVGIYGISYRFFDFLLAIPLFLSNALYPILLKNIKNPRNLFAVFKNYLFVFISLSIVLVIVFWFSSPLFRLIKPDFALAINPFRVLLLSLPLFFLTSFFQWIAIAFKKQYFLMKLYLISALVNILLNLIFIPKAGYMAAAYITLATEGFVLFVLTFVLVKKNFIRMGITNG